MLQVTVRDNFRSIFNFSILGGLMRIRVRVRDRLGLVWGYGQGKFRVRVRNRVKPVRVGFVLLS